MENEKFYLFLRYNNKTVKFEIKNVNTSLEDLMKNLKKAVDANGKHIFDLPDMIDFSPTEYYFGKNDKVAGNMVLYPKEGKKLFYLQDYNIKNGDTLEIIPDPIAG